MKFISHRGNLYGSYGDRENTQSYIEEAIHQGYDVEIDIWYLPEEDGFYLGHNNPLDKVEFNFLYDHKDKLWLHAKNFSALKYFTRPEGFRFNYFWHDRDDFTLTSMGFVWMYAYKSLPVCEKSIILLPETGINRMDYTGTVYGVCSDNIASYRSEWFARRSD